MFIVMLPCEIRAQRPAHWCMATSQLRSTLHRYYEKHETISKHLNQNKHNGILQSGWRDIISQCEQRDVWHRTPLSQRIIG